MDLVVITGLAGGFVSAVVAAVLRLVSTRRTERVAAMGPARLIRQELGTVDRALTTALEDDEWWYRDLAVPTWEAEKTKLASVMTEEEVATFHHLTPELEGLNAMATTDRRNRRFTRDLRGFGVATKEILSASQGLVRLADQAITPVAKGKGGLIRRRRSHFAMSPDPREACRCGHVWAEHRWAAKRRWIPLPNPRAPFVDVATSCQVDGCSCKQFVSADGASPPKRLLRRLRMLPQARISGPDDDLVELRDQAA